MILLEQTKKKDKEIGQNDSSPMKSVLDQSEITSTIDAGGESFVEVADINDAKELNKVLKAELLKKQKKLKLELNYGQIAKVKNKHDFNKDGKIIHSFFASASDQDDEEEGGGVENLRLIRFGCDNYILFIREPKA